MSTEQEKILAIRNSVRVLRELSKEMEHKKRLGIATKEELIELAKVHECIERGEKILGG